MGDSEHRSGAKPFPGTRSADSRAFGGQIVMINEGKRNARDIPPTRRATAGAMITWRWHVDTSFTLDRRTPSVES